jgi:hypothetical protein
MATLMDVLKAVRQHLQGISGSIPDCRVALFQRKRADVPAWRIATDSGAAGLEENELGIAQTT